MDLLTNLHEETLLDSDKFISQLVNEITQICYELSSLIAIKRTESSILNYLGLSWLRSTISLHDFFVLHPQLENFSILLLNNLLFLTHIHLHLVERMLSGRNDIFDSLFRGRSSIWPMTTVLIMHSID